MGAQREPRARCARKSNKGAPHVCSRCLKRSIPSPEFLIRKIQFTEFQAGISATRPGPSSLATSPRLSQTLPPFKPAMSQPFLLLPPPRTASLLPSADRPRTSNPATSPLPSRTTPRSSGISESSAAPGHPHHHHHHASAGSDTSSSSFNSLEQLFSQVGQALQSGSLSNAQSAYASLQQEFAELGSALTTSATSSSSSASSNALNVSV